MAAGKAQDLCSGHLAPWLCEGCTAKTCWDYVIPYCWLAVRNCPDMVAEAWKSLKAKQGSCWDFSVRRVQHNSPRMIGFLPLLAVKWQIGTSCWMLLGRTTLDKFKSKKMMENDKSLGPEQLVFRSLPLPIFLVEFVQVLSSYSVADGFFLSLSAPALVTLRWCHRFLFVAYEGTANLRMHLEP